MSVLPMTMVAAAVVGDSLTGSYSYTDVDGDAEGSIYLYMVA